ncbi:MAG TPA: hypothetical protein VKA30_09980, partial [Actinomycetota bacterium]|nr:hypothetical protein [Actinomycetota bacterium]
FDDGAWFVALAPVTDPDLVPSVIAETLGLAEVRGDTRPPLVRVIDHLRDREALLVLDNFEQIVPAAPHVAELLRSAPAAKIVVTTREPLRISGEQEFPVPPLGLPDPQHLPDLESLSHYEAVALFIDRATSVKPDFQVTNENAPAVAEICARLDGLPLAIELAAARIRLLTPQAMLARLGDRLELLSRGSRDLPGRQQTLRGAIAWSHDLLSDAERALFARLAVFKGGWTLEEAEAVAGGADDVGLDVLEGLESLVDKSLAVTRERPGGELRFGMLETIREFAAEQLDAGDRSDEFRRRHAETYLDLVQRAQPHLTTTEAKQWLDRLEPEHDNVRAALEWSIEHDETKLALTLVTALWRFWQMRGFLQEGRMWADRALAMSGVADHPRERAEAIEAAGGLAYWQADQEGTERLYAEALEAAEALGDAALIANANYNLSFVFNQGYDARARPYLEKSLSLYQQLGDELGVAKTTWALSNVQLLEGDVAGARESAKLSLEMARKVGDAFQSGWSVFMLGAVENKADRFDVAAEHFKEALRQFAEVQDVTGILFNLEGLALAALHLGEAERGVKLGAAARVLRTESGTELTDPTEMVRFGEFLEGLDPELVARAEAEGRALSREEAVAFALAGDA